MSTLIQSTGRFSGMKRTNKKNRKKALEFAILYLKRAVRNESENLASDDIGVPTTIVPDIMTHQSL
jgi:hypothetical protein